VAVHKFVEEIEAEAVTQEYAAAFNDYCAMLAHWTEQGGGRNNISLEDLMDEIEAAKLRLENARTLCEFYVGRALDPAGLPSIELPHLQ
jgi:hypothetical protein